MFSNGKFKNVVADINETYQIKPGETHRREYSLLPLKGKIKTINLYADNRLANLTIKILITCPAS